MTTPYGVPHPRRVSDALDALEDAEHKLRLAGLSTRADALHGHVESVRLMADADARAVERIIVALHGAYTAADLPELVGAAANIRDADLRAFAQARLLNATTSALVRHTSEG